MYVQVNFVGITFFSHFRVTFYCFTTWFRIRLEADADPQDSDPHYNQYGSTSPQLCGYSHILQNRRYTLLSSPPSR